MAGHDTLPAAREPAAFGPANPPALFRDAGDQTWRKVVEFFTARIRNRNTREACASAVWQFAEWCAGHKLTLHGLSPFLVAARARTTARLGVTAARIAASSPMLIEER